MEACALILIVLGKGKNNPKLTFFLSFSGGSGPTANLTAKIGRQTTQSVALFVVLLVLKRTFKLCGKFGLPYLAVGDWYTCLSCEHNYVDAYDCTPGLYEHRKRVCSESGLEEKDPLPHRGLEPASVLRLTFQSETSS